jgi:DNA-binding transcriptional ArsR family regulator
MTYQSSAVQAFAALGDPTRRAIFESLSISPSAVGELATQFPVTRSAVSQHLRILKEAQLVTETSQGTRRIYKLDPRGIRAMREWLDSHWSNALDAFKDFIETHPEQENEK